MSVLRARLLEMEQRKAHEAEAAVRRCMVGSGDRSEKIRTYNFPQDRVTDHRINVDLHNLPNVLDGDLDRLHRRADHDRPGASAWRTSRRRRRMATATRDHGRTRGTASRSSGEPSTPRCAEPTVPIVRATDLTGVHVLKHDDLFMLSDAYGDIRPRRSRPGPLRSATRACCRATSCASTASVRSCCGPAAAPASASTIQLTNPDLFARTRARQGRRRRSCCGASRWASCASASSPTDSRDASAIDNYTTAPGAVRADARARRRLRGHLRGARRRARSSAASGCRRVGDGPGHVHLPRPRRTAAANARRFLRDAALSLPGATGRRGRRWRIGSAPASSTPTSSRRGLAA